ncbi:MAG: CPBP family intramembrane glutamic endopeptidase [Marinicella sp.]
MPIDHLNKEGIGVEIKSACIDLLFVLVTLYSIKWWLLQFNAMWTFAGPISLLAALAVASWRLKLNHQSWISLRLFKIGKKSTLLMWFIVAVISALIIGSLLSAVISSLLVDSGSMIDPENSTFMQNRFSNVPGNLPVFMYWVLVSWVIGGLTEELLFRGFLIIKFEKLFTKLPAGLFLAICAQALIFGHLHMYYQGLEGFVVTGILAVFSGLIFIYSGRRLWPLIISHGLTNTIGMTMIFLNAN